MIRMETASTVIPAGLRELIDEVGGGENGFGGTTVHTGECTLEQYVQQCCDLTDPAKLRPGIVPQTTFWALDDDGVVVGMVRLRHYLNNRLRVHGGHIGYFVRREKRGKGYGKEMLRLALMELRRLGERRALISVVPGNQVSIRVIVANGGRFSEESTDPDSGQKYLLYWIELESQQGGGHVQ